MTTATDHGTAAEIRKAVESLNLGRDDRGLDCRLGRQLSADDISLVRQGSIAYLPVVAGSKNVTEVATVYVDGAKRKASVVVTGSVFSSANW